MPYYLYIPISEKSLTQEGRKLVTAWLANEKKENIILTYAGKKGLNRLPPNAKIYVLMHGTITKPSPLAKKLDLSLTASFPSLSGHLAVTDGKNSINMQQLAKNMIDDGLFNNFNSLKIKLYFCDPINKAKSLADAFMQILKTDNRHANGNIRVDYYPDHLLWTPSKQAGENKIHRHISKSINQASVIRASTIRSSVYSNTDCGPQLTNDQSLSLTEKYFAYKSSRLCGLSGFLKLNGFFSSPESLAAIDFFKGKQSASDKFQYALNFLKKYPENQLSKILKSFVESSQNQNDITWKNRN